MAAAPKTKRTTASVAAFIDAVEDEGRRADATLVLKLMGDATGEKPAMWGPSIIGFGSYASASGDWPIVGFSPRKVNLVIYLMPGFDAHGALLARLGKHRTGKSCLYLNRLKDIDQAALEELIATSVAAMHSRHAT